MTIGKDDSPEQVHYKKVMELCHRNLKRDEFINKDVIQVALINAEEQLKAFV